jgi:hypothetical protein
MGVFGHVETFNLGAFHTVVLLPAIIPVCCVSSGLQQEWRAKFLKKGNG